MMVKLKLISCCMEGFLNRTKYCAQDNRREKGPALYKVDGQRSENVGVVNHTDEGHFKEKRKVEA